MNIFKATICAVVFTASFAEGSDKYESNTYIKSIQCEKAKRELHKAIVLKKTGIAFLAGGVIGSAIFVWVINQGGTSINNNSYPSDPNNDIGWQQGIALCAGPGLLVAGGILLPIGIHKQNKIRKEINQTCMLNIYFNSHRVGLSYLF